MVDGSHPQGKMQTVAVVIEIKKALLALSRPILCLFMQIGLENTTITFKGLHFWFQRELED